MVRVVLKVPLPKVISRNPIRVGRETGDICERATPRRKERVMDIRAAPALGCRSKCMGFRKLANAEQLDPLAPGAEVEWFLGGVMARISRVVEAAEDLLPAFSRDPGARVPDCENQAHLELC